jgi:two-component system OmpR family response regulator
VSRVKTTRIFVVEDHAATARGLKMYLETMGYSVETADSCESARALADRIEFDVLICDLNLPDGDGWGLAEYLHKKQPLRAIAFSAYDEPVHLQRSKRAGFVRHVVKGAAPETLVEAIEEALRHELTPALATV